MTSKEFEHIALGVRPQLMQIAMRFCRDKDDAEDEQLIVKEQIEQLKQCIGQLTRLQQRLIKLMLFDGISVQEIAAITGLTPRSVSSILSTAKRKMMEAMK